MPPAYRSPDQHGSQSNAGRLSYFFAFGAAVFIVSGNPGVAAVFGLMTVAAIAVALRHLPSGDGRTGADPAPAVSEPGPPTAGPGPGDGGR